MSALLKLSLPWDKGLDSVILWTTPNSRRHQKPQEFSWSSNVLQFPEMTYGNQVNAWKVCREAHAYTHISHTDKHTHSSQKEFQCLLMNYSGHTIHCVSLARPGRSSYRKRQVTLDRSLSKGIRFAKLLFASSRRNNCILVHEQMINNENRINILEKYCWDWNNQGKTLSKQSYCPLSLSLAAGHLMSTPNPNKHWFLKEQNNLFNFTLTRHEQLNRLAGLFVLPVAWETDCKHSNLRNRQQVLFKRQ